MATKFDILNKIKKGNLSPTGGAVITIESLLYLRCFLSPVDIVVTGGDSAGVYALI